MQTKTRDEIPSKYKWNLEALIPTDAAWQEIIDALPAELEELAAYRGRLAEGADSLLACLKKRDSVNKKLEKAYVWANMKLHEDTGNSRYQGLADIAERLGVQLAAAAAFIEPEILALNSANPETLREYFEFMPTLEMYRHYIEDLLRLSEHILSEELEEMLANIGELASAPDTIFEMLNNADMTFGTVTVAGEEIELTHAKFGALLESPDRELRKTVWHQYYDCYHRLKNTLGASYNASVKKDVFFAKARKFDADTTPGAGGEPASGGSAALRAALSAGNIPTEVYTALIAAAKKSLPLLHRYIALRKKLLKVDDLQVYDLFTPLIKQVDTKISYDDAVQKVLASLAPLGAEYCEAARAGLENGWADIYESPGKISGAYSWGAYGGHPYILLNYENKIDDMFTLTHELGHAMHSYYSWREQPYIYSGYTIFLAEVASTVNEALLMDFLLKEESVKAQRDVELYLLNTWLDQFRTTFFRQTMFAEFELLTHQMAESGEPLTVESLNELYRSLNAEYYGPQLVLDNKLDLEWARIPHFYRAFYVYQYATGFSAATVFAKRILDPANSADGAAKYLEFLKSGSADYSLNILKNAGVDMTAPQPVEEAMGLFEGLLGRFEG